MSILRPTLFNAPRFPKLFQRSGRAIRAGVIVAKLLSMLHSVPCCSQFGYRTLNQEVEGSIPSALTILINHLPVVVNFGIPGVP